MELVYETQAAAALLTMPRKDARALRDKLEAFAANPHAQHPWAKSFGKGMGRVRHGDWRALYRIDGGAITVVVVRITNRKDVYR